MTTDISELKRLAAEKAVESVESGMIVGLGTGSTAVHALRAIGRLLREGDLRNIVGIPTSEATARQARTLAIPLGTLDEHPVIDLAIDGADEIDPDLNLIKGLGGALLREKIVAMASKCFMVVGDYRKQVSQLGTRAPVPVEVIPFARYPVTAYLKSLGARVVTRKEDGERFRSDEGNIILDCHFDGIKDPEQLAHAIRSQPGIVEHGLFLGIASTAIVATPTGIQELQRA
jgi:ribose 5-phosphate isomerase A